MEITEVRVKLIPNSGDRLKAFCSVTFDSQFVVRDLKIIEGTNGEFVAMPSRKLADRCPKCRSKNHLRSRFCNECGAKLDEQRAARDRRGGTKLHADVAHPINAECRERIQAAVIKAYHDEVEASKNPDYRPIDYDEQYDDTYSEPSTAEPSTAEPSIAEPATAEPAMATASSANPDEDDTDNGPVETSDYESLIRDLKKEAATRKQARDEDFRPTDWRSETDADDTDQEAEKELSPTSEFDAADEEEDATEREEVAVGPPAEFVDQKPEPEPQPPEAVPAKAKSEGDDPFSDFGAGIL